MFGPTSRRNLSLACGRYAGEKNVEKTEGILAKLRDIFGKSETGVRDTSTPKDSKPSNQTKQTQEEHNRNLNSSNSHECVPCDHVVHKSIKYENIFCNWKIGGSQRYYTETVSHKVPTDGTKSVDNTHHEYQKTDNLLNTYSNSSKSELTVTDDSYIHDSKYITPDQSYSLLSDVNPVCYNKYSVFGNDNFSLFNAAYVPQNVKPPIREPNMPEKRDKKDDKKDKKDRKPIIRTKDEGTRHANLYFLPYSRSNSSHYQMVPNNKWGRHFARRHNIPGEVFATYITDANGKKKMSTMMDTPKDAIPESTSSSAKKITETIAGENINLDGAKTTEVEMTDNPEALRRVLKLSPNTVDEITMVDEEYNIPQTTSLDTEISAWQDVVAKIKMPHKQKEEEMPIAVAANIDMVSIRPEPPEPKLDVQTVKSLDDNMREEEETEGEMMSDLKPMGSLQMKQSSTDGAKLNTDVPSRKIHTIRIFAPFINRNIPPKYPRIHKNRKSTTSKNTSSKYTSPFSTITKEPNQQNAEPTVKEQSDQPNVQMAQGNPSGLEPNRPVLPMEPQEIWSNREGPTDIDAEFARSLNTIAEKEAELSLGAHEDDLRMQPDSMEEKMASEKDESMGYESDPYIYENVRKVSARREDRSDDQRDKHERRASSRNNADFVDDGDYVRVPGDPYPYSRDHFYKWRAPYKVRPDFPDGTPGFLKTPTITVGRTESTKSSAKTDQAPPARELSYDSRTNQKSIHVFSAQKDIVKRISESNQNIHPNRTMKTSRFYASSLIDSIVPHFLQGGDSSNNCKEMNKDASAKVHVPLADNAIKNNKIGSSKKLNSEQTRNVHQSMECKSN